MRFVCSIKSLMPEDGGNPHPFYAGYRALIHYDHDPEDVLHGVEVPSPSVIEPGASVEGVVAPLFPGLHHPSPGDRFEVRDGNRRQATGTILEVIE